MADIDMMAPNNPDEDRVNDEVLHAAQLRSLQHMGDERVVVSPKQKAKSKANRKQAKLARRRNR